MKNVPELSHREFMTLDKDYKQAAEAVALVYVKDDSPGIARRKSGSGFSYFKNEKAVRDEKTLGRIKSLVIPPAWTKVWICEKEAGHIQATGLDLRGRKQYRYHPLWNKVRSETKFHRLYEFGRALPNLRKHLQRDMAIPELCEKKVLAAVIMLMERTYIRIGNVGYEKMNGSYGLTTFKDKHVAIKSGEMHFSFKGKKGIFHDISLKNKRLAKIVKQCRDIPGKELFQYYGEDGSRKGIDSGQVNEYIKEGSGMDISAKDFRLWAGSLNILRCFRAIGPAENKTRCKQNVLRALEDVSAKLGNTKTVCKNYYVHPGLIRLYEEGSLHKYISGPAPVHRETTSPALSQEEKVLMKILKDLHRAR